ncbi:MAG: transposase, partial [Planctomycetota bacterium]
MARSKRFKVHWGVAWYHLYNHVAAAVGEYPLSKPAAARKLMALFRFYASVYECALAALCVMGNHYHAVARFEQFRLLSREELLRRARRLNPGPLGE